MFVDPAGFADRMNLDVKEREGLKMVAKSWVWDIERRTGLLLNRLSSGMEAGALLERFLLDLRNGMPVRIQMKVLQVWSLAKGPG